ncbi:DUF192 domain-containing protein [Halobacteriales archaeon QS_8_65_32]|jgi:uncharacterized membrane protein (UPF0127 family)|nr:MAG: DUF192 domain-containing protein [Halobacteriales archaeon QS_8_65_32]
MRIVHRSDGTSRTLADRVERVESWFAKGRGLMFRRSVPEDYALVFGFDRVANRRLHMVCVPFPIDAVWLRGERVERVECLSAWTGRGAARADTVIEFPTGAAAAVAVGDHLVVEE